MACFHAVCNRKCAGWKHLCLARRGTAWYAHGRQRDSSPPERMSWPRRKSGSFFMTGFTGHKKRPDLIRGGPCPLELPRDALSVSLPHLSNGRDKPILTGFTGHKKRPDLIRGGPYPLELPRDALSVSLPHLSNGRDKPILTGFTGHKKRSDLIRGGPYPLELPRGALSVSLPHLDDRQQKEPPAEAEGSSFGLFCFGRWKPDQAAFLALACAASALLPSTTRSMARMTSRMARIARM